MVFNGSIKGFHPFGPDSNSGVRSKSNKEEYKMRMKILNGLVTLFVALFLIIIFAPHVPWLGFTVSMYVFLPIFFITFALIAIRLLVAFITKAHSSGN